LHHGNLEQPTCLNNLLSRSDSHTMGLHDLLIDVLYEVIPLRFFGRDPRIIRELGSLKDHIAKGMICAETDNDRHETVRTDEDEAGHISDVVYLQPGLFTDLLSQDLLEDVEPMIIRVLRSADEILHLDLAARNAPLVGEDFLGRTPLADQILSILPDDTGD